MIDRGRDRRCQGTDGDGDPCPCREDVRLDRVELRWLCMWCRSKVDMTPRAAGRHPRPPRATPAS
jgi:ribosomal protein L44E